MQSIVFDLRDVLRGLRRDRAYAATAILTLALTIGATTAMFSIVNGVLLAPLGYPEPDRLVALREIWRQFSDRIPTLEVNERHFEYWREHAKSFASLAQYRAVPANLTGRGDAAQITVVRTSGSLFDVLQQQAAAGRTLAASDEPGNAPRVVVLTDALWRHRFGSDAHVLGTPVVLDGTPYTVVGVLPPQFRLPSPEPLLATVDAFVAMRITTGWVGDHANQALGRLRPGVSVETARAELDVLQTQISEIAAGEAHEPVTLASVVTPLTDHVVGRARRGLLLLLAAIGAVLLIACSNLANLLLTRTIGRMREAAIRSALGASGRRLAGRALLEQGVLSSIGGALGLWVAWLALLLFVRTAPVDLPRVEDIALDRRVLAFAAAITASTALLVALVPAWRVAGRDVQSALRANATAIAGDRRSLRSQAALLTLQVGLSVTLLTVTAMFGASLARVLSVDRGFVADRVLAVDVAMPASRYPDERARQAVYDRLLAAVRALPGVERVTTTSMLPLRGQGQINFVVAEGTAPSASDRPSANFRFVAPEFFETLGIAIRRGRPFPDRERDPNRPAPTVVSEATAARLWPGEDPIGKRFTRGSLQEQGFEVVGVVGDARTASLDRTPPLMVYVPYWWRSRPSMSLLIRSAVDPASLVDGVRRTVQGLDPEIAIGQTRPLEDLVEASMAGRRYQTQLFVAFGLAALFIAATGIYSVTSYSLSRRRREMNIRVALGARTSQVISLVVRQTAAPVAAGLIAGAIGALAAGGVVASLLFEVRARDPIILSAVLAIVGAVGAAACGLAARHSLSVQPAAALRDE